MPDLKLRLLGRPRIELDDRPVEVNRRKALALLAYLAVEGISHTRDELATLLWPEHEPAQSYAYLRRAIWELNSVLGKGWLDSGRERIDLVCGDGFWLDVARFETGLESMPVGYLSDTNLAKMVAAVSLYQGDFMAGFTLADAPEFDTWQRFVAERLRYRLAQALEQLAGQYERQGDFDNAMLYARRWLSLDTLHEPAQRAMMRLYAASGQRAAAIRQYEACVAIIDDELGLAPEAETTTLYDQITRGDWPARKAPEPSAPVKSTQRDIVRLPAQLTPFVGRTEETEAISTLLADPACRVLSLTGPGGIGKTRLAIRVAEHLVEQSHPAVSDGAYFVALAPLDSSDSIGPAIGKSLGGDFYREGIEPRRQLIDYLRHKRLLLVLDNFEHLLGDESFTLLTDLLSELGDLKLLITSRVRLNLRGEQLFPVAGMKAPGNGKEGGRTDGKSTIDLAEALSFSSLRLFVQSARQVKPDFELSPQNLAAVIRICRAIQGLPLAIELAAGWMELLPPADIAAEIERSLDFLETESQAVPDRQRSIRAVFEYSWQLLEDEERRVMEQLSVFRGGFDRQAAEGVSGASLRKLLSLSNKSWLQQEAAGRFQIHELLRQYAAQELRSRPDAWQQANDKHAAYYADLMAEAGRRMRGPDQLAAIEQVAAEFDNISVAWGWHVKQGHFQLLIQKMLPGLYRFAQTRTAGEELLSLILAAIRALRPDQDGPVNSRMSAIFLTYEIQVRVLITHWRSQQERVLPVWYFVEEEIGFEQYADWLLILVGSYAWYVDSEEGLRRLESLAKEAQRAGDRWGDASANLILADLAQNNGHYVLALQSAKRARQLFQELGDIDMEAHALRRLGSIYWTAGEYEQAEQVLLNGRELFRAAADRAGESEIVQELHELSLMAGKFERAFAYFAERRQIAQALDQRALIHESLHWESLQAVRYGDIERAKALRLEALELARSIDEENLVGWSLWEMGELLRVEGDMVAARQYYDESLAYFQQSEDLVGIAFYHRGLGDIALSEANVESAKERFELCLGLAEAEGHCWSKAYAISGLGRAEVALGNLEQAEQHFRESFFWACAASRDLTMLPVFGLASLLVASGETEQAIELAAFVASYHLSWRETKRLALTLIGDNRDRLSAQDFENAVGRGRQRDLDSVIRDYGLKAWEAFDE